MIVDDDEGRPIYADTAGAAELLTDVGIAKAADRIRDWKRRGLLKPARQVGRTSVYRMADVWAVEMSTRQSSTRRGGARRRARSRTAAG